MAALVGCDRGAIENGMYGFNPSLTMTAMSMFYVPSIGSVSVGVIASIITVFVQLALATSLEPCGLPFMTLPFCIAALAFIVIQGTTSNVISVPLSSMTTPEDHLKRVSRLSHGFELLYGAIQSASYKGLRSTRWRVSLLRSDTTRMSSALSRYDEAVHNGHKEDGLFERIWQCCSTKESRSEKPGMISRVSERLNFNVRSSLIGDVEKDNCLRMFKFIDSENESEITTSQFKGFLQSVGLSDEVGVEFACEAFQLMDLDGSGDIGRCSLYFSTIALP